MDTSETYIKMCREAAEIQEPTKGKEEGIYRSRLNAGDFVFVDGLIQVYCHGCIHEGLVSFSNSAPFVYLLRQEQLQEIIFNKTESLESNMDCFINWLWGGTFEFNYYTAKYSGFDSMEKLWLAYVIEKKYNKKWNGQTWAA